LDGSLQQFHTEATTGLAHNSFLIEAERQFGTATRYSTDQIAEAFIGGGMCHNTCMTAMGVNVY
jgi:hypothetical protein